MGANRISQAVVVTTQAALTRGQGVTMLALFNADGSKFTGSAVAAATATVNGTVKMAATVAAVSAANATDLATAQTLANANKVAINALITSLRAAGSLA